MRALCFRANHIYQEIQFKKWTWLCSFGRRRVIKNRQYGGRWVQGHFKSKRQRFQNEKVSARVLTVLGLVRFLASVSQLLRWLYVLLLHDTDKRGGGVTMAMGKLLTAAPSWEGSGQSVQLPHHQDGTTMGAGQRRNRGGDISLNAICRSCTHYDNIKEYKNIWSFLHALNPICVNWPYRT